VPRLCQFDWLVISWGTYDGGGGGGGDCDGGGRMRAIGGIGGVVYWGCLLGLLQDWAGRREWEK
jgi:hypothetical protein